MKKLKLDFKSLNAEVLTRSQLKQILGGDGGSGGGSGGGCYGSCNYQWTDVNGHTHTTTGSCLTSQPGNRCYCSSGGGTCSGK